MPEIEKKREILESREILIKEMKGLIGYFERKDGLLVVDDLYWNYIREI